MKALQTLFLVVAILAFLGISGAFYTVGEYEQVVITQFGRPVGSVTDAGLHFKVPFIQKITRYEKRILRWDGDPKEVPTRDKRFIWVDATARWRIVDPLRFLQSIGTYDQAYVKLNDILDAVVKDHVSANPLVELVRSTDLIEAEDGEERDASAALIDMDAKSKIVQGREKITRAILTEASKAMPEFGMELVDVRLKRLNYVEKVREKVYERMISERKRKAAQFRSEGEGKKAEIIGQMEKELKSITSQAFKVAEEVRGKADAEAAKIYGLAYNQDPEFYAFYKTLETYKESAFENSTIIIGTDSDYYSVLKNVPR
ncbi:MAG: protease modulator HflC [Deltaproteobacteria bacterium]|jgi:membrane protease subunit HflC|nr:protease modulator HflC [Deltaproteobacteria bacterium]MDX9761642.1 protease modulator HflC [Desulfomonilia bacterium]HPW69019.1 protease modulator HflC [Deltaproteobacteria bacterium]